MKTVTIQGQKFRDGSKVKITWSPGNISDGVLICDDTHDLNDKIIVLLHNRLQRTGRKIIGLDYLGYKYSWRFRAQNVGGGTNDLTAITYKCTKPRD